MSNETRPRQWRIVVRFERGTAQNPGGARLAFLPSLHGRYIGMVMPTNSPVHSAPEIVHKTLLTSARTA